MAFNIYQRVTKIFALKIDVDLKEALKVLANDVANLFSSEQAGGTICYDSAGLAIATTTTKAKTVNAIHAVVNGAYTTVAGTDNAFTLAGTVAANKFNVWVFATDAAGTLTATFGTEGATAAAVIFPVLPYTKAMLGFVLVSAGASPFIGGTTALTGGTVTTTYVNTPGVGSLPTQQFGPL